MNEGRTQLYVQGGDQAVHLGDFGISKPYHDYEILGYLVRVIYHTTKDHLTPETGGEADYDHRFGGEGKRLPMVVYDVLNDQFLIVGGDYTISPEGIVH
jgi:hypothetical protein